MRKIRLQASLDTFIEDQDSHLLGFSGSQPYDSYRLETQSRLGANQALSLTGYEPKIRQTAQQKYYKLRNELYCTVSTPEGRILEDCEEL